MTAEASETPSSSTPILDRAIPIPIPAVAKPSIWKEVGAGLLGVIGAGFIILIASGVIPQNWVTIHVPFQPYVPPKIGRGILLVCAFPVAIVFTILVHELGHTLVGLALGFKLRGLRVGPIEFNLPFRISLARGGAPAVAGWAILVPLQTRHLVSRLALTSIAGPLANLASALAVVFLLRPMGVLFLAFAVTSLIAAIIQSIPVRNGLHVTDGFHLSKLLSSPTYREQILAMGRIHLELEKGVQLDALPKVLLQEALAASEDSPENIPVFALASSAAYYRNDDAMTARCLELCLKHSAHAPLRLQQVFMSDAGVFQARRRKRMDLAQQWLEQIPETPELPWLRIEVEVAILEANGELQAAITKLEALEPLARAFPDSSLRKHQLRSLVRWKSELQDQIVGDVGSPA